MISEVEKLLSGLGGDDIQRFAEKYCDWYDSDYYEECMEEDGAWYPCPCDEYSIVDSALAAIRIWAAESPENVAELRRYCVA